MASKEDTEFDELRPRLCHIKMWPEFSGYGFNLMSKRDKEGHFIDHIDPNSPAAFSGFKNGDKIIEVNGDNIIGLAHAQVAELIKTSIAGEVKLLVVDDATEENYTERGLPIKGTSQLNVVIKGPSSRPPAIGLVSATLNSTPTTVRANGGGFKKGEYSGPDLRKKYGSKGDDSSDEEAVPPVAPMKKRVSIAMPPAVANDIANELLERNAPKPRLCHLIKRPGESFGFSLRTYEDTKEKVITRVDRGLPADVTGVRETDVVIEIDGANVTKDSHRMITARITTASKEIKLLVVSQNDMKWYKANGISPKDPFKKASNGVSGGHENQAFEEDNQWSKPPARRDVPRGAAPQAPDMREYLPRQTSGPVSRESPQI